MSECVRERRVCVRERERDYINEQSKDTEKLDLECTVEIRERGGRVRTVRLEKDKDKDRDRDRDRDRAENKVLLG